MDQIETYLDERLSTDDLLGRLVRDPDHEQGAVHTPREIAQQPYLWRETARQVRDREDELEAFLEEAGLFDDTTQLQIAMAGAGTSDYVGMSLAELFRNRFQTPVSNWPTTRVTASPRSYFTASQQYLILHFARSGNSPESKAVIEFALEHHPDTARHVVITCNQDGQLATIARAHSDQVFLMVLHEATNDKGLAMTSSFSSMVVAGQGLTALDRLSWFEDTIDRVAIAGEHLLDQSVGRISDLAREDVDRVFYLGNTDLLGAATESALKVQELTTGDIFAKGEDTLAFRHGPISAVTSDTLVCFFLSSDAFTRRYELDVVEQFQDAFEELGATLVVVGSVPDETVLADSVHHIDNTPDGLEPLPPYFQICPAVVFGQLFGLFAAYDRGCNVDNPAVDKTLYSRTVQGVTLYEYPDDGV